MQVADHNVNMMHVVVKLQITAEFLANHNDDKNYVKV